MIECKYRSVCKKKKWRVCFENNEEVNISNNMYGFNPVDSKYCRV